MNNTKIVEVVKTVLAEGKAINCVAKVGKFFYRVLKEPGQPVNFAVMRHCIGETIEEFRGDAAEPLIDLLLSSPENLEFQFVSYYDDGYDSKDSRDNVLDVFTGVWYVRENE